MTYSLAYIPTDALQILLDVATDHLGCLANEGRDNEMSEVSKAAKTVEDAIRKGVDTV